MYKPSFWSTIGQTALAHPVVPSNINESVYKLELDLMQNSEWVHCSYIRGQSTLAMQGKKKVSAIIKLLEWCGIRYLSYTKPAWVPYDSFVMDWISYPISSFALKFDFTTSWKISMLFGGYHCIWRHREAQGVQEVQKNAFGNFSTEGSQDRGSRYPKGVPWDRISFLKISSQKFIIRV